MYSITKTFHFSAAHRLEWISDEHHPCSRVHGHNYAIALTFESKTLDSLGFVIDTHRLKFFRTWLDMACEHQYINETLPSLEGETTGERIAEYIADLFLLDWQELWYRPGLYLARVSVNETENVRAEWIADASVA